MSRRALWEGIRWSVCLGSVPSTKCSQGCSGKSGCTRKCAGECTGELGVLQGVLPRVLFLLTPHIEHSRSTPRSTPDSPEHSPEQLDRGAPRFPRASLRALPLRALTSLNKEVRPFFVSDNSLWSLPSVSSLGDFYSISRSWRRIYPGDHSIWVHCPEYYCRLWKMDKGSLDSLI